MTVSRTGNYGNGAGSGSSVTVTGVTLGAGENVIVGVTWHVSGGPAITISSLTDSGGVNTYTQLGTTYVDGNADGYALFYAKNVSALTAGSITAALSGSSAGLFNVFVERWTGLDPTAAASSAVGNTQATPGTGTDGMTTGNITPPVANSMIWALGIDYTHGTGHVAAGTGFTSLGLVAIAATDVISEYKIVSSTTPVAATFTTDINDGRTSVGAAFPLASSGPTGSGTTADAADISAGSGTESMAGSGTTTDGTDISSGTGAEKISGSGTTADAADVSSGSGVEKIAGSGATTDGSDTSSGSGTEKITGSGATLDAADLSTGSGNAGGIGGSGTTVDASDVSAGAGSESVAGSGAAIDSADTSAAAGAESIHGLGATSDGPDQSSGSGSSGGVVDIVIIGEFFTVSRSGKFASRARSSFDSSSRVPFSGTRH